MYKIFIFFMLFIIIYFFILERKIRGGMPPKVPPVRGIDRTPNPSYTEEQFNLMNLNIEDTPRPTLFETVENVTEYRTVPTTPTTPTTPAKSTTPTTPAKSTTPTTSTVPTYVPTNPTLKTLSPSQTERIERISKLSTNLRKYISPYSNPKPIYSRKSDDERIGDLRKKSNLIAKMSRLNI